MSSTRTRTQGRRPNAQPKISVSGACWEEGVSWAVPSGEPSGEVGVLSDTPSTKSQAEALQAFGTRSELPPWPGLSQAGSHCGECAKVTIRRHLGTDFPGHTRRQA